MELKREGMRQLEPLPMMMILTMMEMTTTMLILTMMKMLLVKLAPVRWMMRQPETAMQELHQQQKLHQQQGLIALWQYFQPLNLRACLYGV
jgi:hypothetical protein